MQDQVGGAHSSVGGARFLLAWLEAQAESERSGLPEDRTYVQKLRLFEIGWSLCSLFEIVCQTGTPPTIFC